MSYTPTIWNTGDVITAQKLNKMENAVHAILSGYEPTIWVDGDIITAEKLNKLENAIEYINFDYTKTIWETNDIITALLLNNMENGIEIASADKTWQEMNWKDIIVATRTGKYSTFNVGDMKELDLDTEGVVNMQIAGVDLDILADGTGNASLSFITKECLGAIASGSDTYWPDSLYWTYLHEVIWPKLPQVIRDNIKGVVKYTYTYHDGTLVRNLESTETIWAPSFYEIRPDVDTIENEGITYSELFPNEASRGKIGVGTAEAQTWTLRSAYSVSSLRLVLASPPGKTGYASSPTVPHYVVFGFCL